jgi:hypothetical protein
VLGFFFPQLDLHRFPFCFWQCRSISVFLLMHCSRSRSLVASPSAPEIHFSSQFFYSVMRAGASARSACARALHFTRSPFSQAYRQPIFCPQCFFIFSALEDSFPPSISVCAPGKHQCGLVFHSLSIYQFFVAVFLLHVLRGNDSSFPVGRSISSCCL